MTHFNIRRNTRNANKCLTRFNIYFTKTQRMNDRITGVDFFLCFLYSYLFLF